VKPTTDVYSHTEAFNGFSVTIHRSRCLSHNPKVLALIDGAHPNRICLTKPAPNLDHDGFQELLPAEFSSVENMGPDVIADATLFRGRGSAVIVRAGDCPVTVFYEQTTQACIVTHCGRPAMTPLADGEGNYKNIIDYCCDALHLLTSNPVVHVHIAACISAKHFNHEDQTGQALIAPFDRFGADVFEDRAKGQLDLKKVIIQQVSAQFTDPTITTDPFCTYETDWLASHRRHPQRRYRHPVIVTLTE
jgi:copper oxidase (laccase) domain-containing protein